MSLSIVIPSHNPETIFFIKISEVLKNQPDWQVIIVDDASDQDLRTFLPDAANLTIMRNEQSRGAGACRNIALEHVARDYTVFLDDDDFMDWAVVRGLMAELEAQPAVDMAMSSYRFLRNGKINAAHPNDLRILKKVVGDRPNRVVAMDGNEDLLRVTNFPWNKVYRSTFIRKIGLRFSETAVQNDIYAHWQSIIRANKILVTNLIQCTKTDNDNGARISNTVDNRRLQAFSALRETYELVRETRLPKVEAVFWAFYRDLVRWMIGIALPAARPVLMREHVSFAAIMPPDLRLEAHTGTKKWEIWDMNHISDILLTPEGGHQTAAHTAHHDVFLTEITRLKHLSTELHKDNDQLRGDVHRRDSDVKHRDGELHQLRHDAERLRRENDQLRGDVHQRDGELHQLRHDAERLRRDSEQLRGDVRHRDGELHQLRHDAESLHHHVTTLDQQIVAFKDQVATLDREVNSKAARMGIRIRTFYRRAFPGRQEQPK